MKVTRGAGELYWTTWRTRWADVDAPGYLYTIATVGMSFAGLSVLTMILRQMLGGKVSLLLCAFLLGLATRSVTADTPDDPQLQQHALGAEVFAAHWTFTNTPGAAKFRASSPLFNVNSCSTCHPGGGSGIGPAGGPRLRSRIQHLRGQWPRSGRNRPGPL